MSDLSTDKISIMRHAVGVSNDPSQMPYRNYYAPGGRDVGLCKELAESGHMVAGSPYWETNFYHVTEFGSTQIGLTDDQLSVLRNGREYGGEVEGE